MKALNCMAKLFIDWQWFNFFKHIMVVLVDTPKKLDFLAKYFSDWEWSAPPAGDERIPLHPQLDEAGRGRGQGPRPLRAQLKREEHLHEAGYSIKCIDFLVFSLLGEYFYVKRYLNIEQKIGNKNFRVDPSSLAVPLSYCLLPLSIPILPCVPITSI